MPPHEPEYQWIVSLVPPPPPLSVRTVAPPLQVGFTLAVAEVGSAEFAYTVKVADDAAEVKPATVAVQV